MKKHLTLILIFGIFLSGCAAPTVENKETQEENIPNSNNLGQNLPIEASAVMGGESIELEVAKTPEQQQIGLMYRTSLPDNRGMLFLFPEARIASFWMKNVSINLDMVFLRDGVIQGIEANVPSCQTEPCPIYGPNVLINQVIELRGGRAAELGLKQGDIVEIDFF